MQKKLDVAPRFKSSHPLAVFHITIAGAQQTGALTYPTVVMVPLFTLQINQLCEVPFLHITFPAPTPAPFKILLNWFHVHYALRF